MIKKLGLVAMVFVALLAVTGFVVAQEEATTETAAPAAEVAVPVIETAAPAAEVAAPVNVGNKVCPVTGEKIAELGKDTIEYQGKVYNMCCPMCKDKFLAEPDKYITIVDNELAEVAPAVEEIK